MQEMRELSVAVVCMATYRSKVKVPSNLTCREQEFPHLYRWRDELRPARHFLTFVSHGYIILL